MKLNIKNLLSIAFISALSWQIQPANAISTFGQKEVQQGDFTLVATSYNGGNSHYLTLIGQLSDQQSCWKENGQAPTVVDPLLLNFDFSGICTRAVDGNGYSIRINNQDMFAHFSPKIVQKAGELQLIAQPSRPNQLPLLIARSHGPAQSFSKLIFEPGWRITQRTFGDTTLGHFYLTHDALVITGTSSVASKPTVSAPMTPTSAALVASKPAVLAPTTPIRAASARVIQSSSVFSEHEISPETVVLMATPYNSGYAHQLTVLEQIGDQQKCWKEQGSSPRVIDPLLLNFDFTGICARGTDGNGYSIRVQGEDLFTRYTPKIVEKEGELRLVAKPSRPNDPEFIIARSQGAVTPFSKLVLEPGWRVSKRKHGDTVLGHFYLTNDQSLANLVGTSGVAQR